MRAIHKTIFCLPLAVGLAMLPSSCVREQLPSSVYGNATVLMNVETRAVNDTDGTPAQAEAAVNTLRVYAFVGNELAGHAYFVSGNGSGQHFMDLKFFTSTQTVDFYAIANEAAMRSPGTEISLDGSTTREYLDRLTFTVLNTAAGLPMYCRRSETLSFDDVRQDPNTAEGHEGHGILNQTVSFDLVRPFGKLGVFAAKESGETGTLQVTGLTMLSQGTRMFNYLMPQSAGVLEQVPASGADIELVATAGAVTAELSGTEDRQDPGNYSPVLEEPFYPFENPYGSAEWDVSTEKGNVLRIDYAFDNDPRVGFVHLPPVERNKYYTVCCLMHNEGGLSVEYVVADWDDEDYGDIGFDHPSFQMPSPADGTQPGPDGKYPQPTVWYNSDAASTEGRYAFSFNISGPDGQTWTPTLLDATPDDFDVLVYKYVNGSDKGELVLVENPADYVAPGEYQIAVRALKPENVGKTVKLAISYAPTYDPSGSALMLINGSPDALKWAGSTEPEAIVILQTERPI